MTEWGEIVEADWTTVSRNMAYPKFIFDGRNALDQVIIRAAGFEFVGVGRGVNPKDADRSRRNLTRTENTECQC